MGVNTNRVKAWSKSFKADVDKAVLEYVREKALRDGTKIMQGLVFRSPVLTGAFRGHWFVSFGSAGEIQFNAQRTDKNGSGIFNKGLSELRTLPETLPNIVWYNPTPYGPPLEGGWSSQAPSGIIAPTVAEFRAYQAGSP